MPRIQALSPEQAPAESRPLLEAVQARLGMIPNVTRTLAHSPAVLGAYLKFSAALTGGSLSARAWPSRWPRPMPAATACRRTA